MRSRTRNIIILSLIGVIALSGVMVLFIVSGSLGEQDIIERGKVVFIEQKNGACVVETSNGNFTIDRCEHGSWSNLQPVLGQVVTIKHKSGTTFGELIAE